MEKDIAIGSVGKVAVEISGGKLSVGVKFEKSLLDGALVLENSEGVKVDALVFVDMLFAAIESKSPAGVVAIEEMAKVGLREAIAKVQ